MSDEPDTADDRWARWRDLDPVDVNSALILYNWNVEPLDQLQALCGETHGDYAQEWIKRYNAGLGALWGTLDADSRDRYTELALERYADEVRKNKKLREERRSRQP